MKSFALGGGDPPIIEELLTEWYPTKIESSLNIVLLTLYRKNWESYVQDKYVAPFRKIKDCHFKTILGDRVDDASILKSIEQADLLIIGGGDTLLYHETYCKELIKKKILKEYHQGLPIIGLSAGAIIMGEYIVISPKDNPDGIPIIDRGIGIYDDFFIGVHFSKWKDRENLLQAKKKIAHKKVFGIDDDAYIVFKENRGYEFIGSIHSF